MADPTTDPGTNPNTGADPATSLLTADPKPADPGTEPKVDPTPQTDPKGADPAAKGGDPDPKAVEPKVGAPEKYEFTAPEGITLDKAALEAFEPVARELNLTQEQAQKLVNLQAGMVQKQAEAWQETTKGWTEATKADKEIGGANLTASLNAGKAFLKAYGNEGLVKLLDDYGLGNHPEVIRAFAKAGKAMAEDKFHNGNGSSGDPDTLEARARRMFPNSLKQ